MKINDRIEERLKKCVVDDGELFELLADIQVVLNAYRFIVERKIRHNTEEMRALESWAPGVHKIITEDAER
jgi:hypothetical protein